MSTPAPQRTTYILGILTNCPCGPHLLVKNTDSDHGSFLSGFNGILPKADSGDEAVRFDDVESAKVFIQEEKSRGSSWTYALWIPDGELPTPSPAEGTTCVLGIHDDNPEYPHLYPSQPWILVRDLEADDDGFFSFNGINPGTETGLEARAFASPEDALAYIKDAKENHGSDWTYALWIPPQPQA